MAADASPNLLAWPGTIHGQGLLDGRSTYRSFVLHITLSLLLSIWGHVSCSMCLCFASLGSDGCRNSM